MAAKYRKIDPRIWKDKRFQSLSPTDKLLALYILTCPECNRIGLFNFTIGAAAEDMGHPPESIRESLGRVCDALDWKFDAATRTLWLPTWWKYNQPKGVQHIAGENGALADLHEVSDSPFVGEFACTLVYSVQDWGWDESTIIEFFNRHKSFDTGSYLKSDLKPTLSPPHNPPYTHPYTRVQEQEQEQETKTLNPLKGNSEDLEKPEDASGGANAVDVAEVTEHYRKVFPKHAARNSETRVAKRLAVGYSVDDLKRAIDGNANDEYARTNGKHSLAWILGDQRLDDYIAAGTPKSKPSKSPEQRREDVRYRAVQDAKAAGVSWDYVDCEAAPDDLAEYAEFCSAELRKAVQT